MSPMPRDDGGGKSGEDFGYAVLMGRRYLFYGEGAADGVVYVIFTHAAGHALYLNDDFDRVVPLVG